MATNIKTSSIKDTYDRIVLIEDGATISTGTSTVNIEVQTPSGVATATPLHISTQRVGIGTDAPASELEISGSGHTITRIASGDNNSDPSIQLWDRQTTKLGQLKAFQSSGTLDYIQMGNSDSTGIFIKADGKVGINKDAPAKPLHIREDNAHGEHVGVLIEQDGSGDAKLGFLLTGGQEFSMGIDNSTTGDKFIISDGADLNTNPRLAIDADGDVGIGTLSPSYPLHIEDANAGNGPVALFKNTGSNEDASILFTNDADSFTIGIDGSDSDKFKISDNVGHGVNDRFIIETSGNVTIGNGDFIIPATHKIFLDAGDNTYMYESSDGVIDFFSDGVNLLTLKEAGQDEVVINEGGGNVDFRVESESNANVLFVEGVSDGRVGIGTSSPNGRLEVNGTIIATKPSVTNLGDNGTIPITSGYANIDANGSARTGIRFAGAGTAGQILIVNNTGGETLTFHNTEGTALVRGINAGHDTMPANFMGMFISDGTYWNLIAGGVDTQPDVGLTAP